MNYKKYLVGILGIIILAALFFGAQYLRDKYQTTSDNSNTSPEQPVVNNNSSLPGNYTNQTQGYSFDLPDNLYTDPGDYTYLPYNNTRIGTDASYYHEIKEEYCALSGKCTPTTRDFSFTFAVINSPISEVQKSLAANAGPVETKTFGSVKALVLNQGVEGEGINYYFVAMPNNRTLMFAQKYIDENIVIKYQKVPDFITLTQQNQMMADIISSVKFNQ